MMGIIGGLKVIANDNARLRIAGGPFCFLTKCEFCGKMEV